MIGPPMATETTAVTERPPPGGQRTGQAERANIETRLAAGALALLPGALVVYFGFNGGGFFAGTPAFACLIVIQLLLLRVLLADHPFDGFSLRLAVPGLALAGFVAWVLLSDAWSHVRGRALIEFDRDLLYLLLLVLFGITARTRARIPWIVRGLAAAIVVVCGSGLITRVLPHVWPISPDVANNRLGFPLTYWNALGILATVGIILLFGLSASREEPRGVRALACGAIPVLALTLYFTFSRGAIAALMVGLGLVAGVTVLASSVKASADRQIDRTLAADYAFTAKDFNVFSTDVGERLKKTPGVAAATAIRGGEWRYGDARKFLMAADPDQVDHLIRIGVEKGDARSIGRGEVLVWDKEAKRKKAKERSA